jgi:hypothetical protein
MAKKKKDSLGKLLMTSGNPNAVVFAGGVGAVAVGLLLAIVALFTTTYLLALGTLCVIAGGIGVFAGLTGQATTFEVRSKGLRSVRRGEATEIRWDEIKRVVVQKSLLGGNESVMRVTNLGDGTQEYRGERVMYEFTITGGGEKIVYRCGGPNPSVHPRTLLSRLEEHARGKVTVHEPDQEVYFDD